MDRARIVGHGFVWPPCHPAAARLLARKTSGLGDPPAHPRRRASVQIEGSNSPRRASRRMPPRGALVDPSARGVQGIWWKTARIRARISFPIPAESSVEREQSRVRLGAVSIGARLRHRAQRGSLRASCQCCAPMSVTAAAARPERPCRDRSPPSAKTSSLEADTASRRVPSGPSGPSGNSAECRRSLDADRTTRTRTHRLREMVDLAAIGADRRAAASSPWSHFPARARSLLGLRTESVFRHTWSVLRQVSGGAYASLGCPRSTLPRVREGGARAALLPTLGVRDRLARVKSLRITEIGVVAPTRLRTLIHASWDAHLDEPFDGSHSALLGTPRLTPVQAGAISGLRPQQALTGALGNGTFRNSCRNFAGR